MESISIHSHPKISIDLAGQEAGFVASYSTWDRIDGTVTVEVDHDVQFDDLDIAFEGTYHHFHPSWDSLTSAQARPRRR